MGQMFARRAGRPADAESQTPMLARQLGLYFAFVHCCSFVVTLVYVHHSADGQAPMVWAFFALPDFPVSLLYWVAGDWYDHLVSGAGESLLAEILYLPHVIHGPLGAIWWCFLPRLVSPRSAGGIWGRR